LKSDYLKPGSTAVWDKFDEEMGNYATKEEKLFKTACNRIWKCFQTLTREVENEIKIFLSQVMNELSFLRLLRPQIGGSQTLEDDNECEFEKNLIFRIEMNKFRSIKSEIIFRNDWIENFIIIERVLSQENQWTHLIQVVISILWVLICWEIFFNIVFNKKCKKKSHGNKYSPIFGDYCT
jgi:hypothetical protein